MKFKHELSTDFLDQLYGDLGTVIREVSGLSDIELRSLAKSRTIIDKILLDAENKTLEV